MSTKGCESDIDGALRGRLIAHVQKFLLEAICTGHQEAKFYASNMLSNLLISCVLGIG